MKITTHDDWDGGGDDDDDGDIVDDSDDDDDNVNDVDDYGHPVWVTRYTKNALNPAPSKGASTRQGVQQVRLKGIDNAESGETIIAWQFLQTTPVLFASKDSGKSP